MIKLSTMESIGKKFSGKVIAVPVFIFAMVLALQCFRQGIDLLKLQKKAAVAKTGEERQSILEQLDKYYLTLSIPDSVRQHVQNEVDSLINLQENELDTSVSITKDNIYDVENQLKKTIRHTKIAKILGKGRVFKKLIKEAKKIAATVDSSTNNKYWCIWVEKVANFDSSKAMIWLLAYKADLLCREFSTNESLVSEKYGAFALQLAEQTNDARLQLDINQRLFYVLYRLRELYDLSYPYAKRGIQNASGIKYHLRTIGFLHNYAEALFMAGRVNEALNIYKEIILTADKYHQIPDMSWYEKNGKIGAAKTNCELGNYEQTLSLCNNVEQLKLNHHQKIQLYNYRANAHRNLGNYDMAKENYDKSLALCVGDSKRYMKIIVLKNLAELYHYLTEYDKANMYFSKAMNQHEKYDSQNIVRKIRLLINFAATKAAQNKIDEFNQLTKEANNLIKPINVPSLQAQLLRSLGRMNIGLSKYDLAYNAFERSISVYEKYGLFSAALETKCDLVDCLSGLAKYKQANELLDNILESAKKIHDEQRIIDALGKKAEIANKQGKLNDAIEFSNQLINEIESLSARFTDSDNLIYYRQKIHAYLQNAVYYEIQKGRKDSAFIKLDYMKARALKNRKRAENNKYSTESGYTYFMDIDVYIILKRDHISFEKYTTFYKFL